MPSDEELLAKPEEGKRRLDTYVELIGAIQQAIQVDFPKEAVTALLASFGIGDGFGIYWTTLHLVESFPDEEVLYSLVQQGSTSLNPGTRKWCCYLLGRRHNINDLPFLLDRLNDEVPDVREAALCYGIAMLAQVHKLPQALPAVAQMINDEQETICECAKEVMATLKSSA
jgi:HEAT repeat protein